MDKSLEAFRASREWHADLGERIRDDMFIGKSGFTYWGGFGIIMHDHRWHLILCNDDTLTTDLGLLEYVLWQYAKDEV